MSTVIENHANANKVDANPQPFPDDMLSGYGRIAHVPAEDADLTHVGFGTPMGEMLRRYWQPVCLSAELADLPKALVIMGEELVAFRGGDGQVGVLDRHCAHRGTSLEYGRIEKEGIRCCYHGWLYAPSGRCLQQPGEAPTSGLKDRVRQPAYPVIEYGGLVFIYMGPPDKQPLFPLYDCLDQPGYQVIAYRNFTRGVVAECNWLQIQENAMDPFHTAILHSSMGGLHFSKLFATLPKLDFEETRAGMKYVRTAELPNGMKFIRVMEAMLPNVRAMANALVSREEVHSEKSTTIGWWVPIDDTRTLGFHLEAMKVVDGKPLPSAKAAAKVGRTSGKVPERTSYEDTQRDPDDCEAQVSQRPIAVHKLEHLGGTDRGIVMMRRLLRQGLDAIKSGNDPKGIVRDNSNRVVNVVAGNTITAP
ncbi:MAG: Rieske 2Fe-2S domain-containing protein [Burkholderiales bacterium]